MTVNPASRPMTLPQLFEAQARRTPSAPALISGALRLTYAQLNSQANRLARVLGAEGIGDGSIVAVATARSPRTIVAMMAVLKCGAVYAPLDLEAPRERLSYILDDAQPAVILAASSAMAQLEPEWPTLSLDDAVAAANAVSDDTDLTDPRLRPHGLSAAYLIYTSGSTGLPKGVVVSHAGIGPLASSQIARFAVTPGSRVLQFAPLSFDASISEIVMTLLSGAGLVIAPPERLRPGKALAGLLREEGVTHLTLPPSALAAMPPGSLDSVQALVVAGEPCPPALVERWARRRLMINAYGPTETTVCATMSGPLSGEVAPPLGVPVEGISVYVLDVALRECPPDVPGELYVAGSALALGYLGQPGLTAQRFVGDPFGPPGSRMYRTGDVVVRARDGSLHFLGRSDNQVKIRGFRVDTGEVEHCLRNHPAVTAAAVIARPDPGGALQLLGYVSLTAGARQDDSMGLRRYLADRLPHYLVPAQVMILDGLPVTRHGKIDREALTAPAGEATECVERSTPNQPGRDAESALAALFAKVLGLKRVSPQDSFFDLGGHSLAAVRLTGSIRQALAVEVELDEIYESPTATALAELITARGWRPRRPAEPSRRSNVVRNNVVLLAGSGADHVFCVHAGDGAVSQYRALARQLAPEVTVYGVTAIDLQARVVPMPWLEAIAAGYVDQVRQVQPSGPYHLAGWSSGGLLAYEMACQLAAQGERVGSVTALDTWQPQPGPWRRYDTVGASQWTAEERTAQWHFFLGKLLPQFHTIEVADRSHRFWETFSTLSDQGKRDAVLALGRDISGAMQLTSADLAYVFDVVLMQACALASYQPSAYDGVVDVYVTDFESRAAQTLAYWRSMPTAAIVSRQLPGDHTAVIELPGAAEVASTILARVRAAATPVSPGLVTARG